MHTAPALAALALLAGGAAMLPAPAPAAKAPKLITAHAIRSVSCVPAVANTSRAEVRLWMRVVNYTGVGEWAKHMEARARLETTTPGIAPHSNWVKSKTGTLVYGRKHTYNFKLLTDNKSAAADWRVHLKLVWDRPAPIKDVVRHVYTSFDASCGLTADPGGIASASP
jgi:hypothetical protein